MYALLFADTGLSTAQITSLLIIWSVVPVVLEVPSGAIADLVPRRALLTGGALIRGAGFGLWVLAPGYPAFAAGFVLWGVGSALESGTYESYVYDRLHAASAVERYRSVISSGRAGGLVLNLAATMLAAPLLAVSGFGLVGAVSVAACIAQTVLAATLPADVRTAGIPAEPDDIPPEPGDADPRTGILVVLRTGLAEATRVRAVRRALLLAVLLPMFGVLDEYFGLLARDLHAPTDAVPLLVASTVAAQATGAFVARRCPARWVGPAVVTGGILLAGGALSGSPVGFVGVALGYGLFEMAVVVVQARLQDAMVGRARATVTSIAGMLVDTLTIVVLGAIALGSTALSVVGIVGALGAGLVPVGLLVGRWVSRPGTSAGPSG